MFRTPKFWATKNLISVALLPLSAAYFLGFVLVRFFAKKQRAEIPVICVGNLIAGGSGKTPTAIAIGKILQEMGVNFAFLSRGYGASSPEVLEVKISEKNAAEKFGDEPLLLAETAPTFIAKNRFFGAKEIAKSKKFQAILLDDGMQNNSLQPDFTILVIDGKIGFGNEFLLPAGPMREPINSGLKKADLVIVIGEARAGLLAKISAKKIIHAKIMPKNLAKFSTKKLVAFCGLAYPQKFFSLINPIKIYEFSDHHFYTDSELKNLCTEAQNLGAELITTKKDWVKFPAEFRQRISFLDVELEFENANTIKSELQKIL